MVTHGPPQARAVTGPDSARSRDGRASAAAKAARRSCGAAWLLVVAGRRSAVGLLSPAGWASQRPPRHRSTPCAPTTSAATATGGRDPVVSTPSPRAACASRPRSPTRRSRRPRTRPSSPGLRRGHGVRDNGALALAGGRRTLAEACCEARATAPPPSCPGSRSTIASGSRAASRSTTTGCSTAGTHAARRTSSARPRRRRRRAVAWLRGAPAPWFAWVHYFDPHAPYEPPGRTAPRFADRAPTTARSPSSTASSAACSPARSAERRRTVVARAADHGESLGEHGEATHGVFVYDSTLRVPWIMAGPGVPPRTGVRRSSRAASTSPRPSSTTRACAPGVDAGSLAATGAATDGRWRTRRPTPSRSSASSISAGPLSTPGGPRGGSSSTPPGPSCTSSRPTRREARDVSTAVETRPRGLRSGLRRARSRRGPPKARRSRATTTRERLRALGYVGAGTAPARPDRPRSQGRDRARRALERGLAEARARTRPSPSSELTAVPRRGARRCRWPAATARSLQERRTYPAAIADLQALEAGRPATPSTTSCSSASASALRPPPESLPVFDRAVPRLTRGRRSRASAGPARCAASAASAEAAPAYEQVLAARSRSSPRRCRGLADLALARGDASRAAALYEGSGAADPDGRRRAREARRRADARRAASTRPSRRSSRRWLSTRATPRPSSTWPARSPRAAGPRRRSRYFERAIAAGPRTTVALNGLGFARLESGDARGRARGPARVARPRPPAGAGGRGRRRPRGGRAPGATR